MEFPSLDVCLFCPAEAELLTAEHLWSKWIGNMFPDYKFNWTVIDPETGGSTSEIAPALELKVKAVCGKCNNVWMSKRENAVKPLLSPIIKDGESMSLLRLDRSKIAAFTFKNAVVASALNPVREPFFSREEREGFREFGTMPSTVSVWIGALSVPIFTGIYLGFVLGRSEVHTGDRLWDDLEIYAFTFAIGHLILQLRAHRYASIHNRENHPLPTIRERDAIFDEFVIPLWPDYKGIVQCPPVKQMTDDSLHSFVHRWSRPLLVG